MMRILYTNVFLFIAVLFCILSHGNNPLHKYVEIKERINNLSIHAHLRLLTEIMENGSLNGCGLNDKTGEHDEEEERECDDDDKEEERECDDDDEDEERECDDDDDEEEERECDDDDEEEERECDNDHNDENQKHECDNDQNDENQKHECDNDHNDENQKHECDNDQNDENQKHECDNDQKDESKCKESNNTDQVNAKYATIPIQRPYLRSDYMDDYPSRSFDSNILRTDEVTTRLNYQDLIEKSLCNLKVCKNINDAKIKYAEAIIDSMKLTDKVKDKFKEFMRYYIWKRYPAHQLKLYRKIKKDIEKYTKNHIICSLVNFETIEYELYYLKHPDREMYMSFDTSIETNKRKKLKKLLREKARRVKEENSYY
ncbi:Plasmodium exported protein, unknown function [Plasmodium reichenowi]|uniref:Plasmodium RESA N-terminal domain-containing protein n=1 Tax=Plasmodium reichenowi TaxID=5854 RepID=A0A2P9DCB9_PLARE|nr:Plasmodium exported protein, unknown function [Plasmodium reichenowi]